MGTPLTVREAAAEALTTYRTKFVAEAQRTTPRALARFAQAEARRLKQYAVGWDRDEKWVGVCRACVALCRARGWDPRALVRWRFGQFAGWGYKIPPGTLSSASTVKGYASHIRSGVNDGLDAEHNMLLGAEREFAVLYLLNDITAQQAAQQVRRDEPRFKTWTLKATRDLPEVRLSALVVGLYEVHPRLPEVMPVPQWPWTWGPVRRAARKLAEKLEREDDSQRPKGKRVKLDPDLGEMWRG